MISRKALAGLMLGASVSALVVAGGPARAFELNGDFTRDVSCPLDFPCILDQLEIDDSFSTTGNVIIDGIIGVGGVDDPLVVEDDAVIQGQLIVSPTGQVLAWDADAGLFADAEATAVTIDSDEAPRFQNDGLIEAEAEADGVSIPFLLPAVADADAKGIEHDGEELAEDINNGVIDVDATATAISLFQNAFAEAEATGIDQYVNGDDVDNASSTARVINGVDGIIEVSAQATAVPVDGLGIGKVGVAEADAVGIEQTVDDADFALAEHTNDGLVLVDAEAIGKAGGFIGEGDIEADADATGLNQEVDGDDTATARFINNGTFLVSAEASVRNADGEVTDGDADAHALAVNQEATADEDGSVALSTLTNTSLLSLGATASAFASGDDVEAHANARVAEQDAEEADTATTEVINPGLMYANAYALVWAEDEGTAEAEAKVIDQWVDAEVTGLATVSNPTGGIISAYAAATAIGNNDDENEEPDVDADADATGISQQMDSDGTGTDRVTNDGTIGAQAFAYAVSLEDFVDLDGEADAEAEAEGIIQGVDATGSALTEVINTSPNSIYASATATASGGDDIDARAEATAIDQDPESQTADATARVTNTGHISAYANANAYAEEDAFARAEANAIEQDVDGDTTGTAIVTNDYIYDAYGVVVPGSGTISAYAKAFASATSEDDADAFAEAKGVEQDVSGDAASAEVTNTALIQATAYATALADDNDDSDVEANAEAVGVEQEATADDDDSATTLTTNSGSIYASAYALASAEESVEAEASAVGVDQDATDALTASNTVDNSGLISAFASAQGYAEEDVDVDATAVGVSQEAGDGPENGTATNYVTNSATISAVAIATGGGEVEELEVVPIGLTASVLPLRPQPQFAASEADVFAGAWGVYQSAFDALTGTNDVDNASTGVIYAYADALAKADDADATASAYGVEQDFYELGTAYADLDNQGLIHAEAVAVASSDADASAFAVGHAVYAFGSDDGIDDLILDVDNSGTILAEAEADAENEAEATAIGIDVHAINTNNSDPSIEGTIFNRGFITADADADGTDADAHAIGIHVDGPDIDLDIVNTGVIFAEAQAFQEGGGDPDAEAEGILITNDNAEDSDEGKVEITNDSGAIIAAQSDNGEPFERGTAIDTEDAPGTAEIVLMGNNPDGLGADAAFNGVGEDGKFQISDFLKTVFDGQSFGYIYGDIEIGDDDDIVVSDGKTLFDGVINPEFEGEGNGQGDLKILGPYVDDDGVARAGGTLVMLQNEAEGPSDAHVDEFDLEDGGTLMVELTPEDDLVPGVEANTAVVNGRIFALYNPGFYDDETIYQDVVEAGAGGLTVDPNTFTVEDNSALLLTEPVVENDSIDLKVTRQGFGEVEGLSKNAKHAGNAIEKVYGDLDEESLFGQNVANLFVLADGDYQQFLNQLTGAEYANYLQSVLWSTRVIKRTITERMECDAGYAAGAVANVNGLQVKPSADLAPIGCFTPGTGHIWGRASGSWNNLDGDNSAPGYDETQVSFTVGADYAFTDSFYAGIAGGWIKSEMDFDNFGGRSGASIDYQGWHVAGYGGYDNRVWYLRGIVDFASYDDCEAHRGIRQGTSLVDPSSNDCDSNVFDFYGEAGYRWEFSPNYTLTPFVGVDVGHAELDSFNEKDPHDTGWALKVDNSDADSVETLLGARFGGWWEFGGGVVRPEVMVAWAHEFEDPAEVDVAFRDAPRGANFTIQATDVADNAVVAQVGGTWDITNQFQFGIKWDGRFNEDYNSNSVIGRLEYKF